MPHSSRGRAATAALLFFALTGALSTAVHAQDPTAPAPGAAQAPPAGFVVDSVVVRGAQRSTADAVRAASGIRAGSTVTAQLVQDAVRRLMSSGNFESVQVYVRTPEAGRGALVLDVRERPLVASIRFEGLESVSGSTVRDSAGLRENAPLDPQRVAAARTLVRDLLAKKGVQLTSVDTALTATSVAGAYDLTFRVREGNRVAVADIEFTGNEAFSDDDLRGTLSTREEGFWWFRSGRWDREAFEEDLRTNLPEFYGSHGYIDFAVVRDTLIVDPQSGKARLEVTVSEGPQYRLGEFNVEGNSRFPSEALRESFLTQRRSVLGLPFGGQSRREQGEVFDQGALNRAATDIEQEYRNEGYLFAQVIPSIERVAPAAGEASPRVNVTLAVSEQQPFYIRNVSFAGNTTTHESVIRERVWITPGDVYNEQRVIQSYQSISGLGFFEVPMPLPDIRPDPQSGTVDIVFHVTEKQTGSINFGTVFGGQAYGDSRSRFAGFLGYQQPNLFGQGKQASIRAELGYGRSTFEGSYTDPSIAGGRNSGTVSLFRTGDRYVTFGNGRRTRTGASLQFGFPLPGSLRTRAFIGYSLSRTVYSSEEEVCDADNTSLFCLPDATASTLSFSVARDTKNHPLFPTAGTRQSIQLEQTGGPLGGSADFQKLFTSTEWWVPTGRLGSGPRAPTLALGLAARAGAIFGDASPLPFERFYVGGVQFGQPLRGYQESTIGPRGYNAQCNNNLQLTCLGDAFFTVTAEYALRLTDALSVSAFGDAGNVYGSVGEFNTARLYRGAGVGATLVTPFLGAIGIDAAYGFDRPDPGWEIHFKLGNTF